MFLLHNTFDSDMQVPNKNYMQPVIAFTSMNQVFEYMNKYFPSYNSTPIIEAPLNNNQEYWKIEREEMKKKQNFRMTLPATDDDYIGGKRYIIFYEYGNMDTTYVVDVQ